MLPDKKPNVKIAVIGGGFVGITLAARLLEVENLHITVFDDDPAKIENFKANNYLVDKPGLQEILVEAEKLGNFTFNEVNNAATFNSIFICIGSPKNQNPLSNAMAQMHLTKEPSPTIVSLLESCLNEACALCN